VVVDFKSIADHSRLWIYQMDKELAQFEIDFLSGRVTDFLESWAAHGSGLVASFTIVENRFLIIAADESGAQASGCSIDTLTHFLRDMQGQMEIDFFDRSKIIYTEDGKIGSMPFVDFRNNISSGKISAKTLIYNTVIQQKAQLKDLFLIPAEDSWVA
jgi:hypothetical protein